MFFKYNESSCLTKDPTLHCRNEVRHPLAHYKNSSNPFVQEIPYKNRYFTIMAFCYFCENRDIFFDQLVIPIFLFCLIDCWWRDKESMIRTIVFFQLNYHPLQIFWYVSLESCLCSARSFVPMRINTLSAV